MGWQRQLWHILAARHRYGTLPSIIPLGSLSFKQHLACVYIFFFNFVLSLSGESKTCNLKRDLDAHGEVIGETQEGQIFQLDCDYVAGYDDCVADKVFQYDPNLEVEGTIRKYGPLRGGDAEFIGAKIH